MDRVFALGDLIAAALVILVDGFAGLLIDHLLTQPMAGAPADLVEMGFFDLTRCRIEGDRAGDEGELKIALPVGAAGGGHGANST